MVRILSLLFLSSCVYVIHPTNAMDVDGQSPVQMSRDLQEEAQETKISGGLPAERGRYPYMISLLGASSHYCGGTLVDKDWVLSSARCQTPTQVAIGRTIRDLDSQNDEVINVEYVVIHPDYENPLPNDYDFMMIKLRTSSKVGTPITLDDGSANISPGVDVTTMGWGYKGNWLDNESLFLREVELQMYDHLKCDTLYDGDVTDRMICAKGFDKTFCRRDVGGPLILKGSSASEDVQVGIASWGQGCGENPPKAGVYASIRNGYDFITSTIANPPEMDIDEFPEDGFDYSNCAVESPSFIGDGSCDSYFGYNISECNFDGGDCVCPDDGFDYSGCNDGVCPPNLGDGFCTFAFDTPECNYDGGDCSCSFPKDGFDYSNCTQASPCRIGDSICHDAYNTPECNQDGGDCEEQNCFFPEQDEFDYSGCNVEHPCWIGDGFCDLEGAYNTTECNGDGGDCKACDFPDDGFDYSSCSVDNKCFVGDNSCLGGSYNTSECNYEGGDCLDDCDSFPDDGFDYSKCLVMEKCWIGDGVCEFDELGIYSSAECNYDGGDCSFVVRIFRTIEGFCR